MGCVPLVVTTMRCNRRSAPPHGGHLDGAARQVSGRSTKHGHDGPPVRMTSLCPRRACCNVNPLSASVARTTNARECTEPAAHIPLSRRRAAWAALPLLLWLGAWSGSGVDASAPRHLLADSDSGDTSWDDVALVWYNARANSSMAAENNTCANSIEAQRHFLSCMQFAPGCTFLYAPPPPPPSTALENHRGESSFTH
jgi:hypothetical protein